MEKLRTGDPGNYRVQFKNIIKKCEVEYDVRYIFGR